MKDNDVILAIESGVAGGSISMLANGFEIGNVCCESLVSKAEDLLPNIAKLLDDCGRELAAIKMIAFSNGPGSFTGIRIGAATALGLARSLGIEHKSISVLQAMAISATGQVMVAVPTGRHDLAYCVFEILGSKLSQTVEPRVVGRYEMENVVSAASVDSVLLHHDLYEVLDLASVTERKTIVDCGRNLALLIGLAVTAGHGDNALVPQYLHNPARQRQLL